MSTRGTIARQLPDGTIFGRYHHFDSYPEGLGKVLFGLYRGFFKRDAERMLKLLLDDHTGWSTICGTTNDGADFTLKPGFVDGMLGGTCTCGLAWKRHLCQYDTKDRHSPGGSPNCKGDPNVQNYAYHLGHEFEPNAATLARQALDARRPKCYCHGTRHEDSWAVTVPSNEWTYVIETFDGAFMHVWCDEGEDAFEVTVIDLNGDEPDWAAIQTAGYNRVAA